MEKSTIGQLQYFLTEDLFLIKEDIPSLLNQTASNHSYSSENQEYLQSGDSTDSLTSEAEEPLNPEPILVRGQFEKGILILHEEDQLSEEIMELLSKILQAVGLSMNSVGLVSSEGLLGRSLEEFNALNAHTVIKFGRIQHPINSLPINTYQVHTEEETEYLFADSLSQIAENKELKSKLWNNLKILFNLA